MSNSDRMAMLLSSDSDIGDGLDVRAVGEVVAGAVPDPVRAYLAGLKSPRTQTTMEDALRRAARAGGLQDGFSGWAMLPPEKFDEIMANLGRTHRPATVSLSSVALRGVLHMAWRMELISYEQFARKTAWPKRRVRGSRLPAGRYIPPEELQKLGSYTSKLAGPYGCLVRGCFGVMLGAALRAFEVCSLMIEGYNATDRTVRLIGKGDKEAIIPMQSPKTARAVDEWLVVRKSMPISAPWMFLRISRSRKLRSDRSDMLTVKWLEHMCLTVAKGAGIPRFSPHDCRRTFATILLLMGIDLATVRRLMRHDSADTTALYDMRQALADAAAARGVPSIFDPYGEAA